MNQTLKKVAKTVMHSTHQIRRSLHKRFPTVLGQQINDGLIQIYRNDEVFKTVLSLNHFIEFFTGNTDVDITLSLTTYDGKGRDLGTRDLKVSGKGVIEARLDQLFPSLDTAGTFVVRVRLQPNYLPHIAYLGVLSPQFMTVFLPVDDISAPQMIHSHKKMQGVLPSFQQHRASSHLENLQLSRQLQIYVPNSCRNSLEATIQILDPETQTTLRTDTVNVNGLGCEIIHLTESDLSALGRRTVSFKYSYSRPVDHKKPIIFRQAQNGVWSCNHT